MGINLNFSKEEINEIADSFFKEIELKEARKLELMKKEGKSIFNKLLVDLEVHGVVHDDSLIYDSESYSLNLEEYNALFDFMLSFPEESKEYQDDENIFEHSIYYYEYGDKLVEVFIMWGQGTATSFSLHDKKDVEHLDRDLFISFSDFIESFK